MGVPIGGKGNRPGERYLAEKAVEQAVLKLNMEKGLVEPKHKGKLAFRNVV